MRKPLRQARVRNDISRKSYIVIRSGTFRSRRSNTPALD